MKLLFLLLFSLVAHADYAVTTEEPVLIGGTVADRRMYPATIWIGNCTASIVGPRSVYTAAHCVGAVAAFSIGTERFTAKCMRSPQYPRNATADYALCFTDREVEGVPYENINIDPTHVVEGDWIHQSGFGCTTWGGKIDGQLRVGRSQVIRVPNESSNDYETGNGAVLCSGDSGGPAWSLNPDGSRNLLISINSRSNTTSRSYLSAIATAEGIRFTRSFIEKNDTEICGVNSDAATGCRTAAPVDPVEFQIENGDMVLSAVVQPGANYSAERAQIAMQAVLDSTRSQ